MVMALLYLIKCQKILSRIHSLLPKYIIAAGDTVLCLLMGANVVVDISVGKSGPLNQSLELKPQSVQPN